MTPRLEIFGVPGFPEITAGDDLALILAGRDVDLRSGDIVVVTSKVVSKAEGRLVGGSRDDHLAAETVRVVAARGDLRIVETRHGFVMAAAGIDASNVPADQVALLPVDPDASARRIRDGLADLLEIDVAVIVSDTMGRPWRDGVVDTAIGAAGLAVLDDLRGEHDTAGHRLEATVIAIGDELAAAADLVKGKLTETPVAVIRGFSWRHNDSEHAAQALVRAASDDMFRLGTREAMAELVADSVLVDEVSGDVDEAAVRRAVDTVMAGGASRASVRLSVADSGRAVSAYGDPLSVGIALGRLLGALAAEGLRAAWAAGDPPTLRVGTRGPSVLL